VFGQLQGIVNRSLSIVPTECITFVGGLSSVVLLK
jgi:hypothetical protein